MVVGYAPTSIPQAPPSPTSPSLRVKLVPLRTMLVPVGKPSERRMMRQRGWTSLTSSFGSTSATGSLESSLQTPDWRICGILVSILSSFGCDGLLTGYYCQLVEFPGEPSISVSNPPRTHVEPRAAVPPARKSHRVLLLPIRPETFPRSRL